MKFSHSIQLNACPDWVEEYLNYANLKKLIYSVEKAMLGLAALPAMPQHYLNNDELGHIASVSVQALPAAAAAAAAAAVLANPTTTTTTTTTPSDAADILFSQALSDQLAKITVFYRRKQLELLNAMDHLLTEITFVETHGAGQHSNVLRLGTTTTNHHHFNTMMESASNITADNTTTTTTTTSPLSSSSSIHIDMLSQSSSSTSHHQPAATYSHNHAVVDLGSPILLTTASAHPASTAPGHHHNHHRQAHHAALVWSSRSVKKKKRQLVASAIDLYVLLCNLRNYVELNYTGFSKILKKYDKVTGHKLKRAYLARYVDPALPFLEETRLHLASKIQQLVYAFARMATDSKLDLAIHELDSHLRDQIVWERNTIWRDMIEQERRTAAIGMVSSSSSSRQQRHITASKMKTSSSTSSNRRLGYTDGNGNVMGETGGEGGHRRQGRNGGDDNQGANNDDANGDGGEKEHDIMDLTATRQVFCCGGFMKFPLPFCINRFTLSYALAVVVFFAVIYLSPFGGDTSQIEMNNCFAILVFASLLWALELQPLFVTSILVPFLVVTLRVLRVQVSAGGDNTCPPHFVHLKNSSIIGNMSAAAAELIYANSNNNASVPQYVRLTAAKAAKQVFSDMFSPVIMLLLGGFTLAAALSKHHIAKAMASSVLSRAGSQPHRVVLANMFVSTFASMWISNVAAPVLCFELIKPILRNLPQKSAYAKTLILGIAMAANVGGMASPISSPQNIIAFENMGNNLPSWFDWFKITLPVCVIIDLLVWVLLLAIYKPGSEESALLVQPPELFHHSRMEPVMPNVLGRYYANGKFVASVSGDVGGCQYSSEEEENALPTTALLRKTTSSRLSSAGSVSSGGDRLSNNNNITTTTRRVNINPRNDEEGDDDDDEENAAGLAPMTSSGLFRRYNNRNDDDDDNGRSSCNPWLGGWTPTQFFILAVCVFTILLWCVEKNIEWLVGDMGVIAIIPMVAFFATGILNKEDFNNFLWTVIILAMGGISLGKAVASSGLLQEITSKYLTPFLLTLAGPDGDNGWLVFLVVTGVVVVITTFISHTVGAMIILPIVAEIGAKFGLSRTLVVGAALMCSGAMALPVSSFPNMTAISQEDPTTGIPWVTVKDFVIVGLVSSMIAFVAVNGVSFGIMTLSGFN